MPVMSLPANLDQLSADELRQLVIRQAGLLAESDRELNWRQGKIDKLTHELAVHKRWRFGVKTEHLGEGFRATITLPAAAAPSAS